MKIEKSKNVTRIWLNESYAIMKWEFSNLWHLEYYNLGENYMPLDLYANDSFEKVYDKYEEVR